MFLQLSMIAGCLAVGGTLARELTQHEVDFWQMSIHAVGAGMATMVCSLLCSRLIQKLGGPDQEPPDTDLKSE